MCPGQLAAPMCHFCAASGASYPVRALVQLPRCCPGCCEGLQKWPRACLPREAAIVGEEKAVPGQLSMTTRCAGEVLAEPWEDPGAGRGTLASGLGLSCCRSSVNLR